MGKRIPEPLFFYRAKEGSMIHTLQPHLSAMFARIVLRITQGLRPLCAGGAERFAAAQLPPPKPSSPGEDGRRRHSRWRNFSA